MRSDGVHVVVLIDALGWRLVEEHGFLADRLPHRRPVRTVLGYSSGAIPTLLTGRPPAEHGHWNLFYYDPAGSPFRWLTAARFLPDRALNHRVGRRLLKAVGRRVLGLGPLFECAVSPRLLPYFNWVERRNIYAPGGIAGARSIFDELADAGRPVGVYTYHRWRDAEILDQAGRDLDARRATFFFLYLCELDGFLHAHRTEPGAVAARLAWYADRLREVFERARGLDGAARFTVCSDHGMAPVRGTWDLAGHVRASGLRMPADYLAVYDSTMARYWLFTERARREIPARLHGLPCGRIVPDDELERLGVRFADRRYGELIFLMDPGWLVADGDFNGPGWRPAGMHGYHPDDPDSDAVFLSNWEPTVPVHTLADVHGALLEAVQPERAGCPAGVVA